LGQGGPGEWRGRLDLRRVDKIKRKREKASVHDLLIFGQSLKYTPYQQIPERG